MKKIVLTLLALCYVLPIFSFAQDSSRWQYGWNPIQILDNVVSDANTDYKIQQTALDQANAIQWSYASQYKIANTLDRFRNNINPYLQRTVYIWLSAAVILLIYNGFLMVTNAVHNEWETAKVKKNIINIIIWVIILTWFYFIIKLTVSVINSLFGGYWWNTWF